MFETKAWPFLILQFLQIQFTWAFNKRRWIDLCEAGEADRGGVMLGPGRQGPVSEDDVQGVQVPGGDEVVTDVVAVKNFHRKTFPWNFSAR